MVFDLHNDFLTGGKCRFDGKQDFSRDSLINIRPPVFNQNVIYAVWTTCLSDPLSFLSSTLLMQKRLKINRLAIEDLWFLHSKNLHGDIQSRLQLVKRLSPVYASLTWNNENSLAGGAHTTVGLHELGKKAILFLNNNNILLDTAHLSRPAFYEAIDLSQKPICSHTCFGGVYPHLRNLTDHQISLIIQKNGLIGLCLVPEFMGKKLAGLPDVVRQIDYFVQRFGTDSLCIGSDFFGTAYPALKDYRAFGGLRKRLTSLGYAKEDIDKIFFKNADNFLKNQSL